MTDHRPNNRDSLRSGGYWRSTLRRMIAIRMIRVATALAVLAIAVLILFAAEWYGG